MTTPPRPTSGPNPDRLAVEVHRPHDIDQYWADSLAYLDRTAARPALTPRPDMSRDGVDVYDARFDGAGGVRIAGWYTVPSGALPDASLPGILLVPGHVRDPTLAIDWSGRGYAVLSVAERGTTRAMAGVDPGPPGLLTDGIADPYTTAHRALYLDAVRAFDVLKARPEVDAARLGVHGSSRGGGLGVLVAASRPDDVRCLSVGAPFLCGIMTSARLTHSYPYQEIREHLGVHPERLDLLTRNYGYLDVLNVADKVVCPTQVHLGLGDDVCPPETGFALVETMKDADVELHVFDGCAHGAGLAWISADIDAFLDRHLSPPTATARREHDQIGSDA